jgi:hypothetical protein
MAELVASGDIGTLATHGGVLDGTNNGDAYALADRVEVDHQGRFWLLESQHNPVSRGKQA